MCHDGAARAFPAPEQGYAIEGDVAGYGYGDFEAIPHIAILPDIYGCNPFYCGLARRYQDKGARVTLVDPFQEFGDLPEMTREHAYARRHKIRDAGFIDRLEHFVTKEHVSGVLGFCLGGLYVFELARRDVPVDLVGLYGFPQGMPNQDPLPVPFDYLPQVSRSFTMLMGRHDTPVGPDNVAKLEAVASSAPAMRLKVYDDVGHGFLPLLDSPNAHERGIAEDALARMDNILLHASAVPEWTATQ